MKLQKQLSKKRGKKKYFRYTVNFHEEVINKARFKPGDELKVEAKKGEIKLKKK